jgi:hypothetical protein
MEPISGSSILVNILEEIKNISSKIFEDQKNILDKINLLDERMLCIENAMINIKVSSNSKNTDTNIDGMVNFRIEKLNVDKDDVIKFMSYRDYRAIICIFRLVYKNKANSAQPGRAFSDVGPIDLQKIVSTTKEGMISEYVYPIRISGKRSYDYYNNNKWNPDLYGHHIMNTICSNVQNLFLKYNTLDDEENIDGEDFLLNQKFLCKLSDEKYKREIFKSIIEEVRINSN